MALFDWTLWSKGTLYYICIGSLEKVWDWKCEDEWNLWGEGALYDGYYTEWWLWLVLSVVIVLGMPSNQDVTKRCRLSLLTNSALAIRVQMRGEGGSCGVSLSANEYSCAYHVTWNPNKLWRSTSIFNLCFQSIIFFELFRSKLFTVN